MLSILSKGLARIKYEYPSTSQFRPSPLHLLIPQAAFNGYNGLLDEDSLDLLRNDPSVAFIEPDYIANISYTVSPFQTSALSARHRHHPRASLFCTLLRICPATLEGDSGNGVDIYGLGERLLCSSSKSGFFVCRGQ
jgi:hypothetical protein